MTQFRTFEIVGSLYTKTSEFPKGDDVFYRCTKCGGLIPSMPYYHTECDCGNISVDADGNALKIKRFRNFEVLKTAT
ncbi:hypothetical protein [Symmachiella dynata]|uniref:hypothetical protein n=1 Tax=Symmachiella dynata TaxID=2527995 RepID=UPI0030ED8FB6